MIKSNNTKRQHGMTNKKQRVEAQRPQNIGIKGIEVYIPDRYVNQNDLEEFDGVSRGKYTIGLGQTNMAFVDDREDIYSMSLTVLSKLVRDYGIDLNTIGRLEVGTETLLDKSKSIKSVLMQLFPENNSDVEGVDTVNACYGGTNALFNSLNWIESSSWDGRDAIVVCGDIAIYDKGAARPTGGAGTVAMWIGPDAPLVIDPVRASHMENVYDFYKPDLTSEYPYVDGHFSLTCYVKALDKVYGTYKQKMAQRYGGDDKEDDGKVSILDTFDYSVFHVPTCKLVAKSFARLLYNDYLENESLFPQVDNTLFKDLTYEQSLVDKPLEKTFMNVAKPFHETRVKPGLIVPTNTGNMYTASVYASLASLLYYVGSRDLQGKNISMFSYGSGMAASLFSIKVVGDISHITQVLDMQTVLDKRTQCSPQQYEECLELRERAHLKKSFKPAGDIENLAKHTFYLTEIDDKFKRSYGQK